MPGKLDESYLWQRVSAGEMPPEEREPVSVEERAALERWIAAGAAWGTDPIDRFRYTTDKRAGRDWWAFQPIERPELPALKDAAWPRNEIDHFILARLEAAGLAPSPEADRRTLVRRLHFDLVGLPPTPEEVAAFVADESPDAYEKRVDRLLESPHYGERWARHWLDVVRFGESQGFQRNWLRPDAWKYRDWVILALNQDMPYDEFVRRQIAGDILFSNDPPSIVATGYHVAGPYNLEIDNQGSPIVREQNRQLELADNVATLGQTFLGLTIHCARCHDHKFDPIPQREYYQVASTLATFRHHHGKPRMVEGLPESDARRQAIRERLEPLRARIAEIDGEARQLLLAETESRRQEKIAEAAARLDRAMTALGAKVQRAEVRIVDDASGLPLEVPPPQRSSTGPDLRTQAWLPGTVVLFALGLLVFGPVRRRVSRVVAPRLVVIGGVLVAAALTARGLTGPVVDVVDSTARQEGVKDAEFHRLTADRQYAEALLAELTSRPPVVPPAAVLQEIPPDRREEYAQLLREASNLELEDALLAGGPAYAVVADLPPAAVHVLHRGEAGQPREAVSPAGVAAVLPARSDFGLAPDAPDAERRGRLADWLTDSRNPLTARVIVNRAWHHHFGRGIVATPSDFGHKGALPTHPELLDWLAGRFLGDGLRLKSLHRRIVTSATYRQASLLRPEAARIDGENRLLWRKQPLRHDAEVIRDSVLAVSGLLSPRLGGPGYREFAWEPHPTDDVDANYAPADATGPEYWRRTIYRTSVRGMDDSLLTAFDCPDPSVSAAARPSSTTPVQALSLWNGALMVKAAEAFAARVRQQAGDAPRDQVAAVWRLALSREPATDELESSVAFLSEHELMELCRVIFNLNEFLHAE